VLEVAGTLDIAPSLLLAGQRFLGRGWIDGVPLHVAKPYGDAAYFRSAKTALRKLHRAGIAHNDLAKEQNWLYSSGPPISPTFSLPRTFAAAAGVRLARYEDLRHLLKHKRRSPDALTAAERRILARKTFTRAWMATGKRLYYATTRGLNLMDQEGAALASCIKRRPSRHAFARIRLCAMLPSLPFPIAAPALGSTLSWKRMQRSPSFSTSLATRNRSTCRSLRLCREMGTGEFAAKFSNSWP